MNAQISDFQTNADRFAAVVDGARDADWSGDSPCEGWTAADVVDHVVDTQRSFLEQREADLGPRPTGSPAELWATHQKAVRGVTADAEFVTREYDGFFGRTTLAATLSEFYGFDMLVHRWDVARAVGQDVDWDDAELDRIEQSLDGFGDALYSDGICQPAIAVPDDASRQVRLLGRLGRRA